MLLQYTELFTIPNTKVVVIYRYWGSEGWGGGGGGGGGECKPHTCSWRLHSGQHVVEKKLIVLYFRRKLQFAVVGGIT